MLYCLLSILSPFLGLLLNIILSVELFVSRTYSKIIDVNARPLGYKVGTYKYDTEQSVCVRVADTVDKYVEVKFETEPAAKLCVRYPGNVQTRCVEVSHNRVLLLDS